MHTFQADQGTRFDHNSDFSGDVIVMTKAGHEVRIPGADLLQFVAKNYAGREVVDAIESAMDNALPRSGKYK